MPDRELSIFGTCATASKLIDVPPRHWTKWFGGGFELDNRDHSDADQLQVTSSLPLTGRWTFPVIDHPCISYPSKGPEKTSLALVQV